MREKWIEVAKSTIKTGQPVDEHKVQIMKVEFLEQGLSIKQILKSWI